MFVKHLQEYLDKFTEGPQGRRGNAVSNARIYIATPNGYLEEIRRAEALGPCSSKLVERNIYMYPGSRILELEACGLKLEPLCLGLEACSSLLSRLGA
jgi:hypothetical protein